ncbi:hypothetical protein [Streptomyces sp. Y1]|uniref:Peptidase M41 domain-containing protein n=1 Tax=Streptomyces sp. Y1 TaxID=3238634 RepID=A0AB39TMH2_9ACTN
MSGLNFRTERRTDWHFDVRSGMTTRNPMPELPPGVSVTGALDLPVDELRRALATHEAGHAVVLLHFGAPFERVYIRDDLGVAPDHAGSGGAVVLGTTWSTPLLDGLTMLAAGERAQDRWLRENGRWNAKRGWVTELAAIGDRRDIYEAVQDAFDEDVTFNTGDDPCRDLAALHNHTDALLNALWGQVGRIADALTRHGALTEAQAAEAAGFTTDGQKPKRWWGR